VNEPLISVALCTYNGEKYIKDQLESIIGQSYKNLEIVIVDDVSVDSTRDIINSYAKNDNRIKWYQNDFNLGFNLNFEKAISLTVGDYIAISDQDDVWLPQKLQMLFDNIKDNWLIFSNSRYVGDTKRGKLLKDFNLPGNYKGILLRNYVTGHTSLFSRKFLNYVLPFPQKGYYDWWMGFVAAYHYKIAFLDQVLTLYRVHGDSIIQNRLNAGNVKLQEYENTLEMLIAFAGYKNLKAEDKYFINDLKQGYQLRKSVIRSIPLMELIVKYYRELFPNRALWKVLTKYKFAKNFSKGI
jgi:glycosyltransferase involved in cell wall biosynthesis